MKTCPYREWLDNGKPFCNLYYKICQKQCRLI